MSLTLKKIPPSLFITVSRVPAALHLKSLKSE
jgi:hypothetical protein